MRDPISEALWPAPLPLKSSSESLRLADQWASPLYDQGEAPEYQYSPPPSFFFFFSIWPISPERNSQASAYRLKSTSHVLETLWRPAVEGRFGSLTFENVEFHTFFFSCVWCLQACGLHGPKRISSPSTRVGNGMRLAPKGMGILNSL